eukprot:scaffold1254_cov251-Pinguiococcus_pyrenoidosus.AAC.5
MAKVALHCCLLFSRPFPCVRTLEERFRQRQKSPSCAQRLDTSVQQGRLHPKMRRQGTSERPYDPHEYTGHADADLRSSWEEGFSGGEMQTFQAFQQKFLQSYALASSLRKAGQMAKMPEAPKAPKASKASQPLVAETLVPWHTRTTFETLRPFDRPQGRIYDDREEGASESAAFDLGRNIARREKRWKNLQSYDRWKRNDEMKVRREARLRELFEEAKVEEQLERQRLCEAAFQAFLRKARTRDMQTEGEKVQRERGEEEKRRQQRQAEQRQKAFREFLQRHPIEQQKERGSVAEEPISESSYDAFADWLAVKGKDREKQRERRAREDAFLASLRAEERASRWKRREIIGPFSQYSKEARKAVIR